MKMTRIILWQLLVAVVVAVIAMLLSGQAAGISALLAGLSCVLPNALFAFGLHLSDRRAPQAGLAPLYFWELIKVGLTIALMVAVFWLYRDVNWLAFMLSLVVVLKSHIFLLFKSRN